MLGKGSALLRDCSCRASAVIKEYPSSTVRLGGMACLTYLRTPCSKNPSNDFLHSLPRRDAGFFRICESDYEHLSIGTGVKDPPNCHSRRAWQVMSEPRPTRGGVSFRERIIMHAASHKPE